MNTNKRLKLLLSTILLIPTIIFSGSVNAHDHKQRIGFVSGTATGGHIGPKYRDKNHYRKRNRSQVYFGFNYGYYQRYHGNHIGFGYSYPLTFHRDYYDWRYDIPRNYRRNDKRRHNNSDQLVATVTGVFIGTLIGSEIARYLDDVDRIRARNANISSYSAPIGQRIRWNNPEKNHYGSTTATRDGYSESGKYCREFYQTISIGKRTEQAYGTACQQTNGDWQIVRPLN